MTIYLARKENKQKVANTAFKTRTIINKSQEEYINLNHLAYSEH